MKSISSKLVTSLLAVIGCCAGSSAFAAITYTYTYDYKLNVTGCNGTVSCNLSGSQTGNAVNPAPAPTDPNAPNASISATATGWANTQGNQSTTSQQTLEQGEMYSWTSSNSGESRRGLGVKNMDYSTSVNGNENLLDSGEGTSPEHAVDNDQRYDSILYSFNQSLSLTGVELSWYSTSTGYNDADISVLAYTGDTTIAGFNINNSLTNLRYDQLTANGWSFISHVTTPGYNKSLSTSISSSYWLIGAANPLVGGGSLDSAKDAVKIASLSGKITTQYTKPDEPPSGVPEPGSLALLALGGLLLLRARSKV